MEKYSLQIGIRLELETGGSKEALSSTFKPLRLDLARMHAYPMVKRVSSLELGVDGGFFVLVMLHFLIWVLQMSSSVYLYDEGGVKSLHVLKCR